MANARRRRGLVQVFAILIIKIMEEAQRDAVEMLNAANVLIVTLKGTVLFRTVVPAGVM